MVPEIPRRSLLAGMFGLLAGCSGSSDSGATTSHGDSTSSPDRTSSAASTTIHSTASENLGLEIGYTDSAELDEGEVWVADGRATRNVRRVHNYPYYEVVGSLHRKYLTFKIQAHDLPWRPVTVRLELAGKSLSPTFADLYTESYSRDIVRVGFSIGADVTADEGRLVFTNRSGEEALAAWTLSDELLARLNTPPEFTVPSIDVPARTTSPIPLSITAENTGGTAGQLYGVLSAPVRSHSDGFTIDVPPNETVTHDDTFSVTQTGTVDVTVSFGFAAVTKTVEVESS